MNPLYNWCHELIVDSERMEDMKREAKLMRLVHDSTPSKTRSHTRATVTFKQVLITLVHHLPGKHLQSQQTYRTTDNNQRVA